MNPLLRKLLGPRQTQYFLVNHHFIIQETSAEVQDYADNPGDAIPGADARLSFPELIGIENILMSIIMGRLPGFEVKGIARFADQNRPLYFDMLAIKYEEEQEDVPSKLLILIEDTTEKMVMKQSLIQRANEANLLLSALAASKDYIDKVIRSMGDALLVTTTLGTIKTVNQSAQWLFG
ncbi:MAG TPA: PAS domain-containing sensor histidine kinase, partial [Microcoleus sp.]|nr:PAS domain-containing sensor histidine kinase [Microcoleus sp.]